MQRYFVPENNWTEDYAAITSDDVHHIINVMRMDVGAEIICNHPRGKAALCEIIAVSKDQIDVKINKWLEETVELPINVTIVQGLPKGDKLEWVIQKGTELGAVEFIPFQAKRSIVKLDAKKAEKKLIRWQKIAKEASEQSHRTVIPTITPVKKLQEILDLRENYDVTLIAYEEEARSSNPVMLYDHLNNISKESKVLLCIGPEGGFSEEEIEAFKQNKFEFVRLGRRILRTETAASYFLSCVSFYFEEMR
ncbi:16S rRNA (uracil(1498)-N(3))-methyltransferase [Saliterribacillus persicus]|uniref:Ribosomal RNA small subunit methyltransferase E n=1 Tax=Saliterribacillus persicus TaxID=930114 RepID=A0A368XBI1_9BACI|nr:16S rRNA (uracil(1498)-N(3))-methyltransferase [Saliterribacillus persicus]RCW65323.1 16S rRNA (uracil1498-N3)-methyltransferase [Saliterribacillus persicus]